MVFLVGISVHDIRQHIIKNHVLLWMLPFAAGRAVINTIIAISGGAVWYHPILSHIGGDTKAGMIQSFLDHFSGTQVCSKQIYAEALHHAFEEPKQWEIREINDIMNNSIEGWRPFPNPRFFDQYGKQRGWERIPISGNALPETDDEIEDVFGAETQKEEEQLVIPF